MIKTFQEIISESIDDIFNKFKNTYENLVRNSIIDIIAENRKISEKNYDKLDLIKLEVDELFNKNKLQFTDEINLYEKNKFRYKYVAEIYYNKYIDNKIENISESKDFDKVIIPQKLLKKLEGVSLGQHKKTKKYFIYTHRASGKLYDSPEKIPLSEIKFIESTG